MLERRKMFFEHDSAKKREGQRTSVKKRGSAKQCCRKAIRQKDREKYIWKRRPPTVFQLSEEESAVMMECVIIGILSIAKTSRKIHVKWEGLSVHPLTQVESIHQSSTKTIEERVRQGKGNGRNGECSKPLSKENFCNSKLPRKSN